MDREYWTNLEKQIDASIRNGHVAEACERLSRVPFRSVPRERAEMLAHLFYRVRRFDRSLEIMAPYIFPKVPNKIATSSESATYAISLIKIGAVSEGMKLLESIKDSLPMVKLYTAFGYQASWDYARAIPLLEGYLQEVQDAYNRAVARVNLVSAYIHVGDLSRAELLISETMETVESKEWILLKKNLLELKAQVAAAKGLIEVAEALLKESLALGGRSGIFDFFIRKTATFYSCELGPKDLACQKILQIKKEAALLKHWESIRECDRKMAKIQQSEDLFRKVFFGTPFPAYRKMLQNDFPSVDPGPSYHWGTQSNRVLHLATGVGSTGVKLKPEMLIHRVLRALCSDFYRPLSVGEMHALTFPDEKFNPFSSPGRIKNAISRTRKWIDQTQVPLRLIVENHLFNLEMGPGFAIVVDRPLASQRTQVSGALLDLKSRCGHNDFDADQAAQSLGISRSSILRLLNTGLAKGVVEKTGFNRNRKYRFAG